MIDRVSNLKFKNFTISQGLQNWQNEHLQLIMIQLITYHKCAYLLFWQIFGEEHILRFMLVFQCVLFEFILHVFYVSCR